MFWLSIWNWLLHTPKSHMHLFFADMLHRVFWEVCSISTSAIMAVVWTIAMSGFNAPLCKDQGRRQARNWYHLHQTCRSNRTSLQMQSSEDTHAKNILRWKCLRQEYSGGVFFFEEKEISRGLIPSMVKLLKLAWNKLAKARKMHKPPGTLGLRKWI